MKAIAIATPGGPDVLELVERPVPSPAPDEVLVRVAAASVNRPDVAQRRGHYPPPPGITDIPGLDIAGIVEAVGADVTDWQVGDRVCALVAGGGYAEFCVVPAVQCLPVPAGLDFVAAASLPETFFTAWNNVIDLAQLQPGETLLVQGGAGGVGMAAVTIARHYRHARVFATAGSDEKCRAAEAAGAERAVDYHNPDWPGIVRAANGGRGVDVILDPQAGPYVPLELELLDTGGRLIIIATNLGRKAEVDLLDIMRRRLTVTGSTLRPRTPGFKGRIASALREHVWPLIETGAIRPVIHATFPLADAAAAHRVLEDNAQIGKVVLVADPSLA